MNTPTTTVSAAVTCGAWVLSMLLGTVAFAAQPGTAEQSRQQETSRNRLQKAPTANKKKVLLNKNLLRKLHPKMADLTFTTYSYGGKNLIYPISVRITNNGMTKAGPSKLIIYCYQYKGNVNMGKCLSTITKDVPALNPLQSAQPTLPFAPALKCDPQKTGITVCKVTVKVDAANQVKEANEANNVKTYHIYPD